MEEFVLKRILFFLLTLVALSGCTSFVTHPEVTVEDLNVVSLDAAGAGMELYLKVKNPNGFDVKLEGYSYDLRVMALPLAKGGAREEVKFPAKGETDFRIPIRISYQDLIEILKRKPDPDRIPYQLAAGLELETPVGAMTVPVQRSGTYAIPKEYRPSSLFGRIGDFFKAL